MLNRQRISFCIALVMLFSVVGFGITSESVDAASKKPKKMKLKVTSKTVDIKGKVTISVKSVSPKGASKSVKFKSSNKKIATVNSKGVVTGKKKGKVKITVTSKKNKKLKKCIYIKVKQIKPKVSIAKTATMYSGIKKTVKASVGPKGVYNKGVKYSSSNKSIATVNSKGVVTPKKGGTVKITATSKENKKYKATCKVTVRQSITGISFANSVLGLKTGEIGSNAIIISPSNAYSKAVTYSSSNSRVAIVSNTGQIYAVAPGSATITATAKYGLKTKGSYRVTVTDDYVSRVDDDRDAIYTLDPNNHRSFRLTARRPGGSLVDVEFAPADIQDVFSLANGEVGFDWKDATNMKENFVNASFDYNFGDDFIFSKTGNSVTVKIPGDIMRTSWYYNSDDSFTSSVVDLRPDSDYTITLFEYAGGSGQTLDLKRVGDTLSVTKGDRSFEINTPTDNAIEANIKVGTNSISVTLMKENGAQGERYSLKVALESVNDYNVQLIGYR